MDLMLQVSNFLLIFFVFNGIDENKYAYKNFKSIHTIYYYIIPNNVIGGQANKTYIISITQMI